MTTTTSFEPDVVLCSVSVIPLHVFRQPGPPQRVDCLAPRWETVLSDFLKGHSDVLPHRKSDQGFATFRILARRLY